MTGAAGVAVAVTFVWLGMVLAISFLETPLKFRAPGVNLQLGLGIGRLVFRALNIAEVVLAACLLVTMLVGSPSLTVVVVAFVGVVILVVQIAVVRPALARRADRILSGGDAPRSKGHYVYIGLELIKVIVLIILGCLLLAS